MLRKILKYTLRTLLAVVVLLLAPALLYIPAIQNQVRELAVGYASRTLAMDLSVGRIRLVFPLQLTVDDLLLADKSDTLLRCEKLSLNAAVWPLLRKEVIIRSFALERVGLHYKDAPSGLDLRVDAERLMLDSGKAELAAKTILVAQLSLSGADIRLNLSEAALHEKKETAAPLPWRFEVEKLTLADLSFGMRTSPIVSELTARLADGRVDACRVQLDQQLVVAKSVLLNRGDYAYLSGAEQMEKETPERPSEPSAPWTVRVGSVVLADNRATYGKLNHRPSAGFDPAYIVLSPLELAVDSLYNRGSDVALQIRRMAFTERCGLSVRDLSATVGMNASGISLSGFDLQTMLSRIQANLSAGPGILKLEPATPLSIHLAATLNTKEIEYLYASEIPPVLGSRIVRVALDVAGTLEDLDKIQMEISSPEYIAFEAEGMAENLLDMDRMRASVRFDGSLRNPSALKELLPDSSLRRRIAFPGPIFLRGSARANQGRFSTASALLADGGRLSVEGQFTPRGQIYEVELRCDSFPLSRFLPADSLGIIDLALHARGAGFDPLLPETRSKVWMQINRAEYRGRDFGGVELLAELDSQRLTGRISDRDEALQLLLSLSGVVTKQEQRIELFGDVLRFDLAALGLAPEPIGGSFALHATASASGAGNYAARIALDSIEIRNKLKIDHIRPTSVSFRTDTIATRVRASSGDFSLVFSSPERMDSLTAAFGRSVGVLREQVRMQHIDMEQLQPAMPDFELRVSAGGNNIVSSYLQSRKIAFDSLHIGGWSRDSQPVSLGMRVEGLTFRGEVLDTITIHVSQNEKQLDYLLRLGNAPANLDNIASAGVFGHLVRNTGQVNFYQRNRAGRDGFRFGLDVMWNDSLIRASMSPLDPLFGFEPWTVNRGNYLLYRFDKRVEANLDLTHGSQRVALHTSSGDGASDDIRLDISGLNIGPALKLFPAAPPIDGVLGVGLVLDRTTDSLMLRGSLSVADLSYDKQRFGNVDLRFFYDQNRENRADVHLMLDGAEVASVVGDYHVGREKPLEATATISEFPLARANVFLPADLLRLAGSLRGWVHAEGTPKQINLDGGIRFTQTEVSVPIIGTSFRLSSDTIRVADSRVQFDNYAIYAPNQKMLTIDGGADLRDFSRMTADLSLRASDFQAVNVARKAGTAVYGKAYLDLNASVKGPLGELVVRGDVALLGGTDISYVMQGSPMDVKEHQQNVVTFVSFDDLSAPALTQIAPAVRIGGMDVLLNLDINNDVQAAVDLSADGSNRIDLNGGGNLTYTMNPLGDVRLSGKYVLSGGTVRYNPPVISQKIFRITPNSYVEWVGNIADPAFSITAVETVRANVSADGQENRPVNFDISIHIRNTLNDLDVSFGLAAPEDLTMQNQLNSLTAEQRANQAMNLLIYNTYTGPGTTAKVSSENPLNTFIQKELNQWAQNSLRGVDLSFGIDSYGEDDPSGQRTDYSYRLSKNLFSDRVRVVIGGKLSTDADPSQNLKENLIDDISLEYMLTKRDNMYLKVFRHTGYESILEGEITETGVGFVIRKKISRLGDLFKPMRPKTKKPKNEPDTH